MEIQSPAGTSRDTLAPLHGATRASVRAEEGRPSKTLPRAGAPQPRVHVADYTVATRLDTQPLSSTVERRNIEIELWAAESSGWSPRRPSRCLGFHQTEGLSDRRPHTASDRCRSGSGAGPASPSSGLSERVNPAAPCGITPEPSPGCGWPADRSTAA
jgi:hypothetical protein